MKNDKVLPDKGTKSGKDTCTQSVHVTDALRLVTAAPKSHMTVPWTFSAKADRRVFLRIWNQFAARSIRFPAALVKVLFIV